MLSGSPPTVTSVEVGSTQWSGAFYDYLASHGYGDEGYRIPTGANQAKSLPWFNGDKIIISFSEDVDVDSSDLSLSGVAATSFPITDFFYDALTCKATWTFANPLPKNVYQIDLDGDGLNPVRDLDENVLDGEWTNGSDTFPSGNGVAGGDFAFIFRVMPGDSNQNSGVEYYDYYASSTRQGLTTASPNYNIFADVDGSGVHEQADAQKVLTQLWATYASGSPVGVANDAPTTTGGGHQRIDNPSIDFAFSLYSAFQDAETPDHQMTYQIISNSNPSLFDTASINSTTGSLVVNAATGAYGRSAIVVKAIDAAGLSTLATFYVDVGSVNVAPTVSFLVEPAGADSFVIRGQVTDDEVAKGLIVSFNGPINLRVTAGDDGYFEFAVIVPQEEWDDAWAQTADLQGKVSNISWGYIGIT